MGISLALAKDNNQYGNISKFYIDLTPEIRIKERYDTVDFAKTAEEKFPHIKIENVNPLFITLRMVKSDYEVDCLRKAIALTHKGIIYTLNNLKPGKYEYEGIITYFLTL